MADIPALRVCAKPSQRWIEVAQMKKPPGGALFKSNLISGSGGHQCWLRLAATRHEANASEAEKHHRPCGGFGDGVTRLKDPKSFPAPKFGGDNIVLSLIGAPSTHQRSKRCQ